MRNRSYFTRGTCKMFEFRSFTTEVSAIYWFFFVDHHVYSCFQCCWLKWSAVAMGKCWHKRLKATKFRHAILLFKSSVDNKVAGLLPCFHCVGLAVVDSSIQEIGNPCHDPYILEFLSFSPRCRPSYHWVCAVWSVHYLHRKRVIRWRGVTSMCFLTVSHGETSSLPSHTK